MCKVHRNFKCESFKMYLRLLYSIVIWWEVVWNIYMLDYYVDETEMDQDDFNDEFWNRKLFIVGLYFIMLIWNMGEKCCFSGTRTVVWHGGFWPFLHIVMCCVPIYWVWLAPINCLICTLMIWYYHMQWVKYGENDMKSFKLMGPFRPGFVRIRSEPNNDDVILFYPVNKSEEAV